MSPSRPLRSLNERSLRRAARQLAGRDPALKRVLDALGPPPLWERPAGFGTLLHIILEQQVSLASARAAFQRLVVAASPLTPNRFLELDDAALHRAGFSRQKAGYGRALAEAVVRGDLDLDGLAKRSDEAVRTELLRVKGIGPWTADIYLLMVLLRPDVWPRGDRALAVAYQRLNRRKAAPSDDELAERALAWKPWRAVAARLLWHFYLNAKGGRVLTQT
jgi:DNA-3-methyladenine glycosylase II